MPRTTNKVKTKVVKLNAPRVGTNYMVRTTRGIMGIFPTKRLAQVRALELVQVQGYDWASVWKPVTFYRKG